MIGWLVRSTRGRVAIVAFATFAVIGVVMYTVLDRSSIINRVQDVHDQSLLRAEDSRIAQEIAATGTVKPRNDAVRTIIVSAESVVGVDPFIEARVDLLPPGTDLSAEGLDPMLFDSTVVFYPILLQAGWRAFAGYDDNFDPLPTDGFVVLSAVTDDSVIGPLSVSDALLAAIPVGSIILAAAFALVAGTGLRPVRKMTAEAAEIQIGDLNRRLPDPRTGDELSDLAQTLNGMLARVSDGVASEHRFVADAAHELRSPIAASIALLEVTLAGGDLDWPTTAASVLDEQRRLGALVDDLVLLARLDDAGTNPDQVEPLALDDIVVAETSRPFAKLIEVVDIEPVQIRGDQRALVRLVRNLLTNADRHATTRIEVRLGADETSAILHVDDDGPGVPVSERDRIFDRFARLDDARSRDAGGAGIGLAIVRQVAELYGGTVAAGDSELGGARFTVTLPLDNL